VREVVQLGLRVQALLQRVRHEAGALVALAQVAEPVRVRARGKGKDKDEG